MGPGRKHRRPVFSNEAHFIVELHVSSIKSFCLSCAFIILVHLKGTATLVIRMFNVNELSEPWSLIPVSSKSVGKCGSYGRLNICKWTVMEAAIL